MRYKSIKRYKYKPARWAVERQRDHIGDKLPPQGLPEVMDAGSLIERVIAGLGLSSQHWLSRLAEAWDDVAGANVAEHTRPGGMDGRTLIVYVDSSVWLNELSRYGRPQLLKNIKERVENRVNDIRFQLDPDG